MWSLIYREQNHVPIQKQNIEHVLNIILEVFV